MYPSIAALSVPFGLRTPPWWLGTMAAIFWHLEADRWFVGSSVGPGSFLLGLVALAVSRPQVYSADVSKFSSAVAFVEAVTFTAAAGCLAGWAVMAAGTLCFLLMVLTPVKLRLWIPMAMWAARFGGLYMVRAAIIGTGLLRCYQLHDPQPIKSPMGDAKATLRSMPWPNFRFWRDKGEAPPPPHRVHRVGKDGRRVEGGDEEDAAYEQRKARERRRQARKRARKRSMREWSSE